MTDLDSVMTQAAFGGLVGITQQAVSDLLARQILRSSDTGRTWLVAYCENLRAVAAGRDPDGELSTERARVARATAEKIEMQNAITRRELLPVAVLEVVLNDVARRVGTRLDALVPQIRRAVPELPVSVLGRIGAEVALCREDCAGVNLSEAERLASDADDEEADAA
jgi:terminase small subunit / prophage DNA-packing protein